MCRQGSTRAGFLARALRFHPNWLRILRTARHYRKLPCKYMGAKRDATLDYLLTQALEIHDNELLCECGCGFYRDFCQSEDAEGWIEIDDSTICHARAALEKGAKADGAPRHPGVLIKLVDAHATWDAGGD